MIFLGVEWTVVSSHLVVRQTQLVLCSVLKNFWYRIHKFQWYACSVPWRCSKLQKSPKFVSEETIVSKELHLPAESDSSIWTTFLSGIGDFSMFILQVLEQANSVPILCSSLGCAWWTVWECLQANKFPELGIRLFPLAKAELHCSEWRGWPR